MASVIDDDGLVEMFCLFAGVQGTETGLMDGRQFVKLLRDTNLVTKKFTATDVDIIFAKAKEKGMRKITYDQFCDALRMVAEKKKMTFESLVLKLVTAEGPVLKGTSAQKVALHDDKSLYTGVYANGGPSTVDSDRTVDFGKQMGRDTADVRGVVIGGFDTTPHLSKTHAAADGGEGVTHAASPTKNSPRTVQAPPPTAVARPSSAETATSGTLEGVFSEHSLGAKEMDGRQFVKLCKDSNLLSKKKFTSTDVDIIFAKAKGKGSRKLTFPQFEHAIAEIATALRVDASEVVARLVANGGPVFSGVRTDAVRLHDDTDGYTGVYKQGGPAVTGDHGPRVDSIATLCDRSPADVRGVKQ
eukprot:m.958107 g.958107  ORF g.958107 m.958107 type:complete len:358 (-) comp23878_c0_seq7:554-1627(-)